MSALLSNLEARLLDAFNQKLAFDTFKEKQIDRLHEELQGYKSDLLLKATQPLIAAIIKLHWTNPLCGIGAPHGQPELPPLF